MLTTASSSNWVIEVDPSSPCQDSFGDFPADRACDAAGRNLMVFGLPDPGSAPAATLLDEYRRAGLRAFAALRGQVVALLADPVTGEFLAVRDRIGAHPLFHARVFHARAGKRLLLSPSAQALAAHPGVRAKVNREAIADFFRDSWPSVSETYWEGIQRVPPGHALRVKGSRETYERYWLRPEDPVEWLREDEIREFDARFEAAVGRSMGSGGAGIFLSGGLDSVSVAAVASDLRQRRGLDPLRALSLIFPDEEANEEFVQRGVAERLGMPLEISPLEDRGESDVVAGRSFHQSAVLDSPVLNVWLPSYRRLAGAGRALGCSTILTGTGGDEWLGVTPMLGADLMSEGKAGAWARLLGLRWRSYRQARSPRAVWNYFWHFSARPLARRAVVRAAARRFPETLAARRRRRAMRNMPDWVAPDSRLRATLVERSEKFDALQDRGHSGSFYLDEIRSVLQHPLASIEAEEWYQVYSPLGVRMRHPFYDPDLVDFLYRVPPERFLDGGRAKGLVRATLERRFPGLGFGSQAKVEAANYFSTVVRARGWNLWRGHGGVPALASLGIVDADGAERAARKALEGNSYRQLYLFWSMLNMEAWVRPRI